MRLDCALGHIEIASDFRVVASLQQQIDDLAIPGTDLGKFFFHSTAP